jgi:hypothetical protein
MKSSVGDRNIYETELKDFLPEKIFDSHVHLFDKSCLPQGYEFPEKDCCRKFGGQFTLEQCLEYIRTILPEQDFTLTTLVFHQWN